MSANFDPYVQGQYVGNAPSNAGESPSTFRALPGASQSGQGQLSHPGNSFPPPIPPCQQNPILHDAVISSVTCTGQREGQWRGVPPVVEIGSRQYTLPDSHQRKAASYGTAGYYQELTGSYAGPYTYPDVGHTPGVGPVLVPFPKNEWNDFSGNASQGVVPNSTQATLPDPSAQAPVPGQPAADDLRRLVIRYLNHPDSRVDMVRMESGSAGRYKVVVVLETAGFL